MNHQEILCYNFDTLFKIVEFVRNIRNKYNINKSIPLNLSIDMMGKDIELNDVYIVSNAMCIEKLHGVNIQNIDYNLYPMFERNNLFEYTNIQGYNVYLELPNIDKKSQEESINKEILRLGKQLEKYKSNLNNESFIKNAKEDVIQNMNQKYNDTKETIQSLNANLLMLNNGKLYYDLLTKFGNNEKLKYHLEYFREQQTNKDLYSGEWFEEIYNSPMTNEEISEFHYQQFKDNKDMYNSIYKNQEDICFVDDDGNLIYLS
jgi:hypothetical protein